MSYSKEERYVCKGITIFKMISVEKAIRTIQEKSIQSAKNETISLNNAFGYVLFEDVKSKINMPPFRQSAMDGFALNLQENSKYIVIDEIKAGDNLNTSLKSGEAVRIFTGAPVPDSANAVIMQERTSLDNQHLELTGEVKLNDNIRPLGEQVKIGEIALKKGTKLNAASIGFLASLGITEVTVYAKPKICIIATGNELVQPGKELNYGQIYESNTIMLESALKSIGIPNASIVFVKDNYQDTKNLLDQTIQENDLVIVSGGISVGDYDFVGKALLELQVEQHFYKVKQKPGKPLFFGSKENTLIFALPGNPAAALTCFYIYANTAIQQLQGITNYQALSLTATSTSAFIKKGDRAQFLKAFYANGKVEILEGQSSAMLQTFAVANAFVFVHEDLNQIEIGETVPVVIIQN